MDRESIGGPTPLKGKISPKNTRMIAELDDIDINSLTPREQVLLRIINDLDEEIERSKE